MCRAKIIMLAVTGWLLWTVDSPAQTLLTNVIVQPPTTRLEAVENTVGKIVFKGRTEVGTVSAAAGSITIFFKEDLLVGENTKERGVAVIIKTGGETDERALIDYDELDSLASALDYLSRITWSATTMTSFNASYTSKAGLRFDSFGNRRSGKIEFSVRSGQMAHGIALAPENLAQIRSLLDQARRKLDELPKN